MFQLGSISISDEGGKRNPAQAKEWFEKAAAEGNTAAMRNLAGMYAAGDVVEKDPAVANQRFVRKAKPCSAKGLKGPRLRYGRPCRSSRQSKRVAEKSRRDRDHAQSHGPGLGRCGITIIFENHYMLICEYNNMCHQCVFTKQKTRIRPTPSTSG